MLILTVLKIANNCIYHHIANATLYKSGLFDWNGIVPKTESLDNLDNLDIQVQVQTDKDEKTLFIQCMIQILLQFHQLVK